MNQLKKYLVCACLVGAVGLGTHLALFDTINHLLDQNMKNIEILHPPYPFYINLSAWLTAIFPGLGIVILYSLVHEKLKFKSRIVKGIVFALLLLLAEGSLIRQPIMNVLVGNPVWIMFIQQLNTWLPVLLMSIVTALLVEKKIN